MIIFLYGEDDFRAKRKLKEIRENFSRKADQGGFSFDWLDGAKTTLEEINQKAATVSLLSSKRMVVIENFFNNKDKNLLKESLKYFQEKEKKGNDNAVVFLENSLGSKRKFSGTEIVKFDADGRDRPLSQAEKALFNFLSGQAFKQEFKKLNNLELTEALKKDAAARGGKISSRAAAALIAATGGDSWQMDRELNKLIHYKMGEKPTLVGAGEAAEINENDIAELVRGGFEENIFALTDAIGARNRALVARLLEEEIKSGANEIYLLTMIIRQIKIILQVRQALDSGSAPKKIAADLKLNAFVASKAVTQARNFNLEMLKKTLGELVEIDYKIKSGRGEPLTLLDLLMAKI